MNRAIFVLLLFAIFLGGVVFLRNNPIGTKDRLLVQNKRFPNFKTNTAKSSIDLNKLLSGGPGKDGIPALSRTQFVPITSSTTPNDVLGILVSFNDEQRYYPYNILLWHEVVNDAIGTNHIVVTFCPLCGSAIVFNRNVKGDVLEFHVSGLLFESNLVMYDTKTESFWSQIRGEAIVGDYTTTKLEIMPMQQITFRELKHKYPDAKVLSTNTGYSRDYSFYPYGNYKETEELYFPVSIQDKRFKAKEIMYAVNYKEKSIVFPEKKLLGDKKQTLNVDSDVLTAQRNREEITVSIDGKPIAGYYVMWFSWVTHHLQNGIVWDME